MFPCDGKTGWYTITNIKITPKKEYMKKLASVTQRCEKCQMINKLSQESVASIFGVHE
jgi:hypothetical protein